jgi:hypothetical protein
LALTLLGVLLAPAGAVAVELRRSAFVGAGRVGDRTIDGFVAIGDPIAGFSSDGVHRLWHGFLWPLDAAPTGVAAIPAGILTLSPPTPNPAAVEVAIRFRVDGGPPATISIFDLCGRRVRRFTDVASAGEGSLFWRLDADGGARLPSGLYFIRLETTHQRIVRPVMVLD